VISILPKRKLGKYGVRRRERKSKKVVITEKLEILHKEIKKLSDYAAAILIVCGMNLIFISLTKNLMVGRFAFQDYFFGAQLFVGGFLIHKLKWVILVSAEAIVLSLGTVAFILSFYGGGLGSVLEFGLLQLISQLVGPSLAGVLGFKLYFKMKTLEKLESTSDQ